MLFNQVTEYFLCGTSAKRSGAHRKARVSYLIVASYRYLRGAAVPEVLCKSLFMR